MRTGFRCGSLAIAGLLLSTALTARADYSSDPRARQWIADMVRKHDWQEAELVALMAEAERQDAVVKAIARPAESKEWAQYQDIFITSKRVDGGRAFQDKYGEQLQRAEASFGVPSEVVVAILGVETYYGEHMGSYRVIDTLATQAFEFDAGTWRSRFGHEQLEHFVLLCKEQGLEPLSLQGSYAGAMGYGQFIPSSYRHYAVDFDGDGVADIWNNPTDAIGSVANYLSRNGWKRGGAITVRAQAAADADRAVLNRGLKPDSTVLKLANKGYRATVKVSEQPAGAVELQGKGGAEYWLGLKNYFVITTYNQSRLYAMAVNQLSELVGDRSDGGQS